ncbi:MAG: four helix bundle protein [Chitinophagales bacterium]
MFLELGHTKLQVYTITKKFVSDCYKATAKFPNDEKYSLISQIRRAAISVHLNLAEGSSRKSEVERKRFYEISRSSIIEVDAGFDLAGELGYCNSEDLLDLKESMINCFKYITGLINANK